MRLTHLALGGALGLALLAGCQQDPPPDQDMDEQLTQRRTMNAWTIEAYTNRSIEQAILRQRTLFPYHFVVDTAELNELGERDLAVLAKYLQAHPGTLNLRRGGADEALYDARLERVRQGLSEWGVDLARVTLGDELPGGDGLVSERTLVIMGAETERPTYPQSVEGVYSGDTTVQIGVNP